MAEVIDSNRRRLLSMTAMTLAAAPFRGSGPEGQPGNTSAAALTQVHARAKSSFGVLKQIDAGVLNVGYAEVGPASGPVVILLHGWPYDIHTYVDVAPLLASGLPGDRSASAWLRHDAVSF